MSSEQNAVSHQRSEHSRPDASGVGVDMSTELRVLKFSDDLRFRRMSNTSNRIGFPVGIEAVVGADFPTRQRLALPRLLGDMGIKDDRETMTSSGGLVGTSGR